MYGRLVSLTLAAAVLGGAAAPQPPGESRVTVEFLPRGVKSSPYPVQLSFVGKSYMPDRIPFPAPGASKAHLAPEERFLVEAIATGQGPKMEELVRFYNPPERAEFAKRFANPETTAAMKRVFDSIESSAFVARLHYGDYVLLMVEHRSAMYQGGINVRDYVIKRGGGSLYLTNELQDDPVYAYLTTKYTKVLQEQIRGK